MINFTIKLFLKDDNDNLTKLFIQSPSIKIHFMNNINEIIMWGDPIPPINYLKSKDQLITPENIITNISGHYYYILKDKINNNIYIGNSIFSILPIYYCNDGINFICSDTPLSCIQNNNIIYNKRYLLESILFNYQIFNQSVIKGVKLVPSNNYIDIKNGNLKFIQHSKIENYFSINPKPLKKSLDGISDLFLESIQKYLPEEKYITALTGGFDGRTLVAAGLYYKKDFSTYSFGSKLSDDVNIARNLSNLSGLTYNEISLDDHYVNNESFKNGLEFIINSSGGGAFPRSHYLYACKQISHQTNYIITGNFGSEIMRAIHVAQNVVSLNMYNLFLAKNYDEAITKLSTSNVWKWLNRTEFKSEWESLKEDIKMLPCFSIDHKSLTKSQQFYILIFEEVFRKYFGAEMVNQFQYSNNRTPFLDLSFLKGILQTEVAGVHSDFFTHNPIKRFKGQVLYAHIIRKAFPKFGTEMTDKGYRPFDLLSFNGKIRISKAYLDKKIINKQIIDKDVYSVNKAFNANFEFWENIELDKTLFNAKAFENAFKLLPKDSNLFFISLSQAWLYNYLLNYNNIK